MVRWIAAIAALAVSALGADDPWAKVKNLKSGSELRIVKRGVKQPVLATFDELTDEKLIVATKTEQIAISKDDIERIDARPPHTGSRVKTESRTKVTDSVATAGRAPGGRSGQSVESGGGLVFGGKGDFETVYRRTATSQK
jgi:hypothetical protein